jgi:hypothetical protein
MYFSAQTLFAFAALIVAASATCGQGGLCIPDHKTCTGKEDDCCEGFDCFGYNFFKRCQTPPVCLDEWYDCNSDIACCAPLLCVTTGSGMKECQKETPGMRKTPLPPGEIKAPPPTPPPINTKVTKKLPITWNKACLSGDPHITTFDGLNWDCQSVGEHILFKSLVTRRQVQGRFTRVLDMDVSVMQAVVIQDEGDVYIPKVQLSMPVASGEGLTTVVGTNNCKLQLWVDDKIQDLKLGFRNEHVEIKLDGVTVSIKYLESKFLSTVRMSYWNGCLLNACFEVPTSDTIVGMMGNPDGNAQNDWMTRTGDVVPVPPDQIDRLKRKAYDYCRNNWCIKTADKSLSLFEYNQAGFNFEHFNRCDLEYGTRIVEFVDDADEDMVAFCKGDMPCLMDAIVGGLEAARQTRYNRLELQDTTCKKEGGACDAGCCVGFTCVNTGMEKKCSATPVEKLPCMVSFAAA